MIDILDQYYLNILGYNISKDSKEYKSSKNVIDYLVENCVSNEAIIDFLEEISPTKIITFDMLPDWLWSNSLLEQDVFYYHPELQMPLPKIYLDIETGKRIVPSNRLEMKIQYDEEDILSYFYARTRKNLSLCDKKKDIGAIKYLLNKYERFSFIEPIDYLLYSIDYFACYCSEHYVANKSILSIDEYNEPLFYDLQEMTKSCIKKKKNRIIWRK